MRPKVAVVVIPAASVRVVPSAVSRVAGVPLAVENTICPVPSSSIVPSVDSRALLPNVIVAPFSVRPLLRMTWSPASLRRRLALVVTPSRRLSA